MRIRSLVLLLACVAIPGCDDDDSTGPSRETFAASLSGAAERPNPVTTTATGASTVELTNPTTITYDLNVQGIDSVTAAHIHRGGADQAGPIIVFLFGGSGVPATGLGFSGRLNQGTITPATQFNGTFTFDSLLTHMRAGTAYVNVHTRRNPAGEIRGQLTLRP